MDLYFRPEEECENETVTQNVIFRNDEQKQQFFLEMNTYGGIT